MIEDQEIAAAIVALSRATVKIADLLEVIVSASVKDDQPDMFQADNDATHK
jgi:hypothetical protein